MSVLTERDDVVTTIRLNRPEKLNALNEAVVTGLNDALRAATRDADTAIMLAGAGRATCAGMDTSIVSQPDYAEQYPHLAAMNRENRAMLREHALPTAMAARGAVVGAGFGFSCHCDFVVLGEDTHYSYPEIEYELVVSSAAELAELVGPRAAKEIVLTADPIPADRALSLGLANAVVPEEEVESTTRELLERVMEHDPGVVRDVLNEFR